MREMNFSQRLRRFIVRKTFSAPYRVQFYEALRFLLENKQPLKTALEQMRDAGQTLDENGIPLLNWPQTVLSLFVKTVAKTLWNILLVYGFPRRGCSNQCRNKKWFHCGCITICHHTYRCQKATPSGHMANGYLPGGVVNHDDGDIICS